MDKKNIALVVTSLESGGLERNASILANHFSNIGLNVYICCLKNNNIFFSLNKNIKVIDMTTNKNKLISFNIWKNKLRKFFLENKINTVISFGDRCGILTAKAIKDSNINHICRAINNKKNIINKVLLRNAAKNINHFIFQTSAQKVNYPKVILDKGIHIPNPFELYNENLNIEGLNSKRFVTVASFKIKQKRQDLMVKAFKKFSLSHPEYIFEMYGRYTAKDKRKIDSLIKKEDLVGKVFIKGENKNIKEAIIPSRAFICASTHEGMPNALIEALSYGVPVISSNWLGSKEIIENNKNGLIFKMNDVDDLVSKMLLIAEEDELFNIISNNSYTQIIKDFEKNKVLKMWEQII